MEAGINYTWHIAVGIPKTAMGVTAILPTAMVVTAITAIQPNIQDNLGHFWGIFEDFLELRIHSSHRNDSMVA